MKTLFQPREKPKTQVQTVELKGSAERRGEGPGGWILGNGMAGVAAAAAAAHQTCLSDHKLRQRSNAASSQI